MHDDPTYYTLHTISDSPAKISTISARKIPEEPPGDGGGVNLFIIVVVLKVV